MFQTAGSALTLCRLGDAFTPYGTRKTHFYVALDLNIRRKLLVLIGRWPIEYLENGALSVDGEHPPIPDCTDRYDTGVGFVL